MNIISLCKKFSALLNETYKASAKTAALESDASLVREGANANELVTPSLTMDGLANYSRNSGYVDGNVCLTWQTNRFNYERGRLFSVDAMDDEESQHISFGALAGEFVRTKAVPELDAFRFASIAGTEGISRESGEIADGKTAVTLLRKAVSTMDAAEVPSENRILFITPEIKGMIDDMDTVKSRAVMTNFEMVVIVPQSRFYSAIKLHDGVSDGEEGGGYSKAEDGKNINFMIVHKPAVLQFTKHAVPKIISPANNPDSDAWKYGYRSYGICSVYPNKAAGVYCHISNA
ncbi:MAG: hypothetical protein J6A37_06005 [Oscillospiraceae bacterium]|nr:hypothetical protein [Oscillospiraceae bacterium]